jgi:hypothetical protein
VALPPTPFVDAGHPFPDCVGKASLDRLGGIIADVDRNEIQNARESMTFET